MVAQPGTKRKLLPPFYYLDHFDEFLLELKERHHSVLDQRGRQLVAQISNLDKPVRAMLARTLNRASPLIKYSTLLKYEEIDEPRYALRRLQADGFLAPAVTLTDSPLFTLEVLTKDELLRLAQQHRLKVKHSITKKDLIGRLKQIPLYLDHADSPVNHYVIRSWEYQWQYLLFIYFGHLRGQLSQFSLRDLGISKHNQEYQIEQKRFLSPDQARRLYHLKQPIARIDRLEKVYEVLQSIPALSEMERLDDQIVKAYNQRLFRIYETLYAFKPLHALHLIRPLDHEGAQEFWCRKYYEIGDRKEVYQRLHQILGAPQGERLTNFAHDFLARKFNEQRLSMATEWLKSPDQHIELDEIHKASVEHALVERYRRQGLDALFTENRLWRALFGLAFWDLIYYTPGLGLLGQFDQVPKCLRHNNFYDSAKSLIETRLSGLVSRSDWSKFLQEQHDTYHGRVNCLFVWHAQLLTRCLWLIERCPLTALRTMLKEMSKDWLSYSDGFPDLCVWNGKELWFEEVKAPGDQLRRNQVITIEQLKRSGFMVRLTTVAWRFDPWQPYSVVDLETTGGKKNRDRVIEVGVVRYINNQEVARFHRMVNPQRLIPRNITRLTGISQQMVVDAPTFEQISDELFQFLQGSVFVAHNVNFDYGFLRAEYERLGQRLVLPKLCTVQLARKYFKGLSSYSLAALCQHFSINLVNHHRAIDDAVAAGEILKRVVDIRKQNDKAC